MSKIRYTSILIILLAVIFLPYWIYLPLLGAAMIFFPFFWEGIILAVLIDVLYGGGVRGISQFLSPMAFTATVILIILIPMRERIRVNA